MSVSYFVRYDIAVSDVTDFVERYRSMPVPLVAAWPGPAAHGDPHADGLDDPFPVNRGRAVLWRSSSSRARRP